MSKIISSSIGGLRALVRDAYWCQPIDFSLGTTQHQEPAEELKPIASSDYFNGLNDMPVPDDAVGCVFCFEIATDSDGFQVSCNDGPKIIVTTYPRKTGLSPECTLQLIWKSEKVFAAIAAKRMSETVAVVTGRLKFQGDVNKMEPLVPLWEELHARLMDGQPAALPGEDDADEEEDPDEIWKGMKPSVEPRNPCTKDFWVRHFSTDALVGSWLWLASAVIYAVITIIHVIDLTEHSPNYKYWNYYCQLVAAVLFAAGSYYFLFLSYPEVLMKMVIEMSSIKINELSFTQRYFTGSDMLIASWFFVAASLPFMVYDIYLIVKYPDDAYSWEYQIVTFSMFSCLLFFVYICLPEVLLMNNGRGSTMIYDNVISPFCCISLAHYKELKEASKAGKDTPCFWERHFANDMVGTMWILVAVCAVALSLEIVLVIMHPYSIIYQLTLWMVITFFLGSVCMVFSMNPDNMHSRVVWDLVTCGASVEYSCDESSSRGMGGGGVNGEGADQKGEESPLIP